MADELEIVGRLSSTLPEERRTARERLDSMGSSRALKLLLSALGNENWRIRKTAADVLATWHEQEMVIKSLLGLLGEDSDAARRSSAVEVLTRIGAPAVDQLLVALRANDPHVRKLIVDVLGAIADPRSEKPLIEALSDKDENVRMASAEALSNFKDGEAASALLEVLRGTDNPMRFYAMESLAKMNIAFPIKEIRPLVDKRILRRAALTVLGNCRDKEAVKLLTEAILDTSRSNRMAAVRSLAKLYKERLELREIIGRELSSLGRQDKIIGVFNEAVNNAGTEVRRSGIRLLGILSHRDSAQVLINAARDNNLQPDAVDALGRLARRSPEAIIEVMPPPGDPLRELVEQIVRSAATPSLPVVSRLAEHLYAPDMADAEFSEFRNLLHKFCGIYFNDDMKFILEKRLAIRLEILGLKNFPAYLSLLKNKTDGAGELGEAINILTTNETYFFREKFQLRAFKEEILPGIHEEKDRLGERKLRIWSAGCSSGEEVYTIAILVDESGLFEGWDIEILGSDISGRVLEKAHDGVYSKGSFRETPERYLMAYFKKLKSGDYILADNIRHMVDFKKVNLVNIKEVGSTGVFDVVFCRNVIIYFDIEAKRKVIDYLFTALKAGGYLLLGHSESLLNISAKFDLVHLKSDMVYRKPAVVEVGRT